MVPGGEESCDANVSNAQRVQGWEKWRRDEVRKKKKLTHVGSNDKIVLQVHLTAPKPPSERARQRLAMNYGLEKEVRKGEVKDYKQASTRRRACMLSRQCV
jgi:hypothetical protein